MKDCPICSEKRITLRELKKIYIQKVFNETGQNKLKTAKILGVGVRIIRTWVKNKFISQAEKEVSSKFISWVNPKDRDKWYNKNRC